MKTKFYTIAYIAIILLFIPGLAKAQDTTKIILPVIGMEERFSMHCYRVATVPCKEVTYVSTLSSSSGFTPVKSVLVGPDTIMYTDTIKSGLPKITLATNFWIKKELITLDDVTVLATSTIATVTVLPKPLIPLIAFASTPVNDGKVYANLNIELNVVGKLQAFTVFNAEDTTNGIPRKSWYLDPKIKNFIDSTYQTTVGVWVKYQLTDTIKPDLTTSTKWVYVPAFIPPAPPEIGINKVEDSTTTIVKIDGWCVTKNLNTDVKIVFAPGDTSQTITLYKSNGLSYWSIIDQNRTAGTTYQIVAIAINSKGSVKSSVVSHTMGSNPKVLEITSFDLISRNGGDVEFNFGYSVPENLTATAIVDYDNDSTFTFPEDWENFSNLVNSGKSNLNFFGLSPGTYWARVQINDGSNWISKKIQFEIWSVGIDKFETSKISIYPNPSSDFLNVPYGPWQILNASGQVIKTGTDSKIDIREFLCGIYLFKNELGNTRFIKN